MQSTPSSLSLSGPLWPGKVPPERVQPMGHIEINVSSETELFEIELFLLLTVCKQKTVFLC